MHVSGIAERSCALALALLLAFFSGCAHHAARVRAARLAFLSGDLETADRQLDKLIGDREEKQEVLLADKAIVSLLRGDVEQAEALLQRARDGFDFLRQRDVAESTLSLLTDDRRRAYVGEDYEQILVCNFLAITNLLNGGEDAVAYCLQANQKQQEIIRAGSAGPSGNPKLAYKRVALGAYLYGAIQEATHQNYHEAQRAYASVAQWNPAFRPAAFDLQRVQTASHSQQGHGVCYVIALVGPGPRKEDDVAPVTSQALAIAGHILHALGDHKIPPYTAPVKIPTMVVPPSNVDHLLVSTGGHELGMTETITDVGRLAVEQRAATRDHDIAWAVARRVVKKATIYKVHDQLPATDSWASLVLNATGFLWEASETVDTRCWSLLPGQIQVLRCELPAGVHALTLRPIANGQIVGASHACQLEVVDGRNTFALACFPDRQLVGKVLTSKPSCWARD